MTLFFGSIDAVVGLELLAKTIADKHMASVLPNYVLVRHLQRLESLFHIHYIYLQLSSYASLIGS